MAIETDGHWWSRARTSLETWAASRRPGRTASHRPFEPSSHPVAYVLYVRAGDPTPDASRGAAAAHPGGQADRFGFPHAPAVAGIDEDGALFDTAAARFADDRETCHLTLRFGGRRRLYRLIHEGAGTYTSTDATMTFRWGDRERFQELDAVLDRGAAYRVSVRDVVQLEPPGGRFDWAVTRADFTERPTDDAAAALIYVVWRVRDPGPDRPRGHPGAASGPDGGPVPPAFPADQTPTVGGDTLLDTVRSLIAAGRPGTAAG